MTEQKQYLNLRESYQFDCYSCGHSQRANPSMFMSGFQANWGGGRCLNCKTYFQLKIDDKNERMISFPQGTEFTEGPLPDACYSEKEQVGKFL